MHDVNIFLQGILSALSKERRILDFDLLLATFVFDIEFFSGCECVIMFVFINLKNIYVFVY